MYFFCSCVLRQVLCQNFDLKAKVLMGSRCSATCSHRYLRSMSICASGNEHFLMVCSLPRIPLRSTFSGEADLTLGRSRAWLVEWLRTLARTGKTEARSFAQGPRETRFCLQSARLGTPLLGAATRLVIGCPGEAGTTHATHHDPSPMWLASRPSHRKGCGSCRDMSAERCAARFPLVPPPPCRTWLATVASPGANGCTP